MKGATKRNPAPPSAPPGQGAAWLVSAVLFLVTFALFVRVCGRDFDFVNYDDPDYVTANSHVKAGLNLTGLRWAMTASVASNWHPLTWMSHMLDWSLYGDNPRGHHLSSVLLHALNAVLAFLAFRRLTGAFWTSALCAALFAWHPLRVESVAWVAERKDVLSGVFWFVVLWAYAVYAERRRTGAAGAGRFYALALVAFALGLMAKPMLVTLPCVLLLLDVWPLKRISAEGKGATDALLEKIPFFVLTAVSCVVTYHVQHASGAVSNQLPLDDRFGNATVAVIRYLAKFLVPFDLAVLYPHPGEWTTRKVVACGIVLLGLSAFVWAQRRPRPWIGVGWLWFLGTLIPVIGLVQVGLQSMADRYTYLTMLGVEIAVLWSIRDMIVSPAGRRIGAMAAGVILLFCMERTWDQLGVWKNSGTLFTHALAVTENNYVAHDNRGLFLYKAGRFDEAVMDYKAALAINSSYLNANNNLGHALYEHGQPAEALPYFRRALQANPDNLEVRNNLANALSDLNQPEEAMEHYEYVLAHDPDHVNALNGSGVVLAMRGNLREARARLEKSLVRSPDNASALNNLGNICSMLKLPDEAIGYYRHAARANPEEAHSLVMVGQLLNAQGKFAEAAEALREALARNPGQAEAHALLGFALAQVGRRDEAIRELRMALQQQPDYPQAKAWLEALGK